MRLIQVGLGLWGLNWAKEVIPHIPGIEITAHVDASADARQRAIENGLRKGLIYSSLDEALSAGQADAVLVTVPLAAHEAVCRNALERGLHVLVEKPFCPELQQARALVELAEQRRLHVVVNQNYRYFSHPQFARQLLASGTIGAAQAMRVTFSRMFDEGYRYFFLEQPLLSDMAIHHFDLMRFILSDEPKSVVCRSWSEPGTPFQGPPAASAIIEFRSGTVVSYFGSWIARGPNTAYGGRWTLDAAKGQASWSFRGDSQSRHAQDRFEIHPDRHGLVRLPEVVLTDRQGVTAAFAKLVDRGELDPVLSTARDNLASLQLMECAIRSAEAGGQLVEIEP